MIECLDYTSSDVDSCDEELSGFELEILGKPGSKVVCIHNFKRTCCSHRTGKAHSKVQAAKSTVGSKPGSKLRRRAFRAYGDIDNNVAVNSIQCRKVVRRSSALPDTEKHILYAFPSFDRSDALLFLPSTLLRHLNAADMKEFSRLLLSRLDKNCDIRVPYLCPEPVSPGLLIQFHELLGDIHPDSVACVHSTKVVENKIMATIHAKLTAVNSIYDSVARETKDPLLQPMFGVHRSASIIRNINMEDRPEEEKDKFITCVNSTQDNLVLYVRFELALTVNDFTKKVTRYELIGHVTSIHPADW